MFVKYLILFFISMVPIVELRGAIPYSVVFGLPLIPSYIICVIVICCRFLLSTFSQEKF